MTIIEPHVNVEYANTVNGFGPWWIAHEHPERPPDDWALWSWGCDACMYHLVAAVKVRGDEYSESVTDGRRLPTTLAATLADARAWRAENDLRDI